MRREQIGISAFSLGCPGTGTRHGDRGGGAATRGMLCKPPAPVLNHAMLSNFAFLFKQAYFPYFLGILTLRTFMSHPARRAGLKRGEKVVHSPQAILCPHPVWLSQAGSKDDLT